MIENYGYFYKNYEKGLIYDIKYFERFMVVIEKKFL